MRSKNKVLFGILLLLGALALVLFAFFPEFNIFGKEGVPVWKVLIELVLLYWFLNRLLFGKTLLEHFDALFPLALTYALFYDEINTHLAHGTLNPNTIWIVIVATVLILGSLRLIFNKPTITVHKTEGESYSGISGNGTNSFGSKILCLDASQTHHSVANRFGAMTVIFQNTEINDSAEVNLEVSNQFGEVSVKVPSDWAVFCDLNDSFGSHSVRANSPDTVRTLRVSGSNAFGEVNVNSD